MAHRMDEREREVYIFIASTLGPVTGDSVGRACRERLCGGVVGRAGDGATRGERGERVFVLRDIP